MYKESFDPVNEVGHDTVARCLGWTIVSNKASLYSQQIKGTENIIADSLSRDLNISDQPLRKKINSILPPQTAASFHIKLRPREIISWILSISTSLKRSREFSKILRPGSLATGKDVAHYSHTYASRKNSWTESNKEKIQSWCHPSHH